ncbi:hypothetical protein F8568_024870 [Actinomadura sp. LD22]|uniref:EthD domain-containing protein n=2 Tax=Actinomadura physcomitrii TaxID=2650748 RepID=A0A6I4MHR6_9ACTN|nr:hypothetical protein [Actinomadura physcomitrii]
MDHTTADHGAAAALPAPQDVRPVRTVLCTALPDVLPGPRFAAISLQWFADAAHLTRFASWLASPDGAAEPGSGQVVVVREHPLRGAEWLERRWREGGARLKHMAIARRAEHLTPDEFSDRWRDRAGRVGAVAIPARARGQAYVQNHPLPKSEGTWPFDAVNEVYFDDLDGLRERIAWFAEHVDGTGEDDLVGEHWFVAVREEVL